MKRTGLRKVVCVGCGWVGYRARLGDHGSCPACGYEWPMSVQALLHTRCQDWGDVAMAPFLQSFLKVWQEERGK